MSERKYKRVRKSKLVPRNLDGQDKNVSDLQGPSKKAKKMHQGPSPLEFNVKIEVEEFSEDFGADERNNLVIDEDALTIKSEVDIINEEIDIEPDDEQQAEDNDDDDNNEEANKEEDNKKTLDDEAMRPRKVAEKYIKPPKKDGKRKSLLNEIYNLSQKSAISVKQCKITNESLFNELDKLMSTELSPADRKLAIEVRNCWGRVTTARHTFCHIDAQIQMVIEQWKGWFTSGKLKETPLLYICYLCQKGWWRLHEFREHLLHKHDSEDVKVYISINFHECCLTANSRRNPQDITDISVDSECWRCGNDFSFHKPPTYVTANPFYACTHCDQRFYSCTAFTEHRGTCLDFRDFLNKQKEKGTILEFYRCSICKIILTTKRLLHHHMANFHSVRSDLPMPTSVKNCNLCHTQYIEKLFHTCPRKNYTISCPSCKRRFPSRLMTEFHKAVNNKQYKCKICEEKLESQCMEMEHLMDHTDNFRIVYKCVTCEENIFLMDESSMKQHIVIWHKKFFDKRRRFVEMVVVPTNCITENMVEQLDIVSSLSGKFEIFAKPNSSGVLEVSQVEEIDFNKKAKDASDGKNSDDDSDCKIIEKEIDFVIIDGEYDPDDDEDINSSNANTTNVDETVTNISANEKNTVSQDTSTNQSENATEKSTVSQETSTDKSEGNDATSDLLKVKIKVEKDDEIQMSINKDKDIYAKEIKTEPNLENFGVYPENDDYAKLLSKVFGGSHNVTMEEYTVKEEIDEEFFEDDIIDLVRNVENIKAEVESPEEVAQPSTSHGKGCTKKNKKCKHCLCEGNQLNSAEHLITCTNAYKCTKCNNSYISIEEYADHFALHGYDETQCPACDMVLSNKTKFPIHLKMHVRYSFFKKQLLDSVNVEKPTEGSIDLVYSCRKCKENVDVEMLFAHWENHLSLERRSRFKTDFNKKLNTYLDQEVLKDIKAKLVLNEDPRVRDDNKDNKTCLICKHQFNRKNDHKRHLIEHLLSDALAKYEDNNGLVCHFCGKTIVKNEQFREHVRDHSSLPVYRCMICSKSFSDSSNFSKHKKIHNFHLHHCAVCKKKFHSAVMLEKHQEIHESTEPIKCSCCDKIFYEASAYRKHKKAQSSKSFSCPICKTKYPCLKDKWDHMWGVHKIRKHKADCPICPQTFRKLQDVRNHMKQVHNKKVSFLNKQVVNIVKLSDEKLSDNNSGMQIGKVGEEMYVVFEDEAPCDENEDAEEVDGKLM